MMGYYYLHANGDLIYKPRGDAADFRESDFVVQFWPLDPQDRETAWNFLVEALSLGASKSRINQLADKWGCGDHDANTYAERLGVTLQPDGNMWCATGPGFVNLAESPAGFGENKLIAMADLCKALGYKAQKMWGHTFQSLLANKPQPPARQTEQEVK